MVAALDCGRRPLDGRGRRESASFLRRYDYRSLAAWTDQTPNWRDAMAAPDLRWHPVFAPDNATFEKNVAEVERVLASGPAVLPCRAALAWPPEEGGSDS